MAASWHVQVKVILVISRCLWGMRCISFMDSSAVCLGGFCSIYVLHSYGIANFSQILAAYLNDKFTKYKKEIDHSKMERKWNQSNYSSRIVFSHIPIECGCTGNNSIRSADLENPTVEPNMKWIGRPLAEIWPFEIFQMWGRWLVIGRWSSVGRSVSRSVVNIYFFLHWSHIYTPLRYVSVRGVKM